MRVLYVGSGAVNLTLAGWMHSGTTQTSFLVRTPDNPLIDKQAFQCRLPGDKNTRMYKCKALAELSDERPDLVVFGVKSYTLESVAQAVSEKYGKELPAMSVLNGVKHIDVLNRYFHHTIFATIGYNAYRESPALAVAVGGSVVLSSKTADPKLVDSIYRTLRKKIRVTVSDRPLDVAHCKLIINLGNALLTMVGFHEHRHREIPALQKVASNLMWEGVKVMRKSGVKEAKIPGIPPWFLLRLSAMLPSFIVVPIFEKKMRSSSINSMAQDLQRGADDTELEDINGYFLKMAEQTDVSVPYNRAVYWLFKEWLASGRQPLRPSEVLAAVGNDSS